MCIRAAAVSSNVSLLIDFIKLRSRTVGLLAWISNDRDISKFRWIYFWGTGDGGTWGMQEGLAGMYGGYGCIQRDAKIDVVLQDWRDVLA